jgi:3-oxoacyl-[acyl-carrier-protein] synthase-3
MATVTINNVVLRGVSACVPKSVVFNSGVDYINEKELQVLIKTVGVQERRLVNNTTLCSDLCFQSTQKLLESLKWQPKDVDILIFVSQSRDYILPSTSILLQEKLGMSKSTLAFDIPLGCSGYTYGLMVLSSVMTACRLRHGLLLAGDLSTTVVNEQGQKTFPLFGDAGTATALEYKNGADAFLFEAGSDGSGSQAIIIPSNCQMKSLGTPPFNDNTLVMNGVKVFEFSIREVPNSIKRLLEFAGISVGDIDYFIMHQANQLMNETIRKIMGFTQMQTPYSLQKFGNTSSASIPLTMVTQLKEVLESKTCKLLLSGFGVGLSWSSALLQASCLSIPDLIEYDK